MKKKHLEGYSLNSPSLPLKFLRVMKLSVLLTCILSVNLMASVYSQNARFDLDIKDQSVRDILKTIEKESQFRFFYNDEFNDLDKKLTFSTTGQSIDGLMTLVLDNTEVSYKVLDNNFIVITPKSLLQQNIIKGTVSDENGNPLPGVNVQVEGTTIGAITDGNGIYSIDKPNEKVVLIFSFIGYNTQKLAASGKTTINITLVPTLKSLDEVVVVGYGTQKKVNITGSVSNISSENIIGKTVTQASLALAGEMSGVSVRQLSGNPGSDQATIRIRGLGTFSGAGNNPLVIVDGVESSLNNLNPNDIKNISILKDAASSAIYGSKAANGVILVETKRGTEGKMKISYNTYFAKQKATEYINFVDSWTFAEALNEALTNMGSNKRFTDEDIQKFKSGEDPINFPNIFHYKDMFTSGSGFQNRHDITFNGGTSETQYYFSGGYLRQDGLVEKNFYDRYDMRLNLNSKIAEKIFLKVNVSGNVNTAKEPTGRETLDYIVTAAVRLPNYIPGAKPDGSYGNIETHHPEADLASSSFAQTKGSYMSGNVDLSWNIFKDLKITGKMGYAESNSDYKKFTAQYVVNPTITVQPNKLTASKGNSNILTMESLIEYDKLFGDHSIHILGGFSQQVSYSNSLGAYRYGFPNNELFEINAASPTNSTNSGSASRNKLRSYFGRANYSYMEKYLFEANLRYDGSSRFPEKNRYGLFPSFSAGWRISKEKFFQNINLGINDLKIRGSWGELGNQSIGNYPYQELISLNQNYPIAGSLIAGAAITTLPNKNIIWETTRMKNVGLDASLINNKINLTVDYFIRTTYDILYNVSASSMLGATPSVENAGTVENRGWDFNLEYKNSYHDFSYSIAPTFSVVHNEVLKLANVKLDIARGLFVGKSLGSIYGYVSDGLFVDAGDIQNYATQPYVPSPGTIRYKDISGPDGVPDGVVTPAYDRKVIGSTMPSLMYGLRMNAKYKNLDLFVLFQGEGGNDRLLTGYELAFCNQGNIQKWQLDARWTNENPNPNAKYPRLDTQYSAFYWTTPSTYWLSSCSFLRLKNIQLGYSLPSALSEKLSISMFRVYISGQNILTFSKYKEGWDPEMEIRSNTAFYPPTAVFSAGINVVF